MRPMASRGAFLLALAAACALLQGAGESNQVWWEGEDAVRHNFDNTSFSTSWLKKSDGLSGGQWATMCLATKGTIRSVH